MADKRQKPDSSQSPDKVDNATPPSEPQLKYLKDLGYKGPTPKTMDEAGDKINELRTGTKPKPTASRTAMTRNQRLLMAAMSRRRQRDS